MTTFANIEEAEEFIAMAHEMEGEQRAEYGSGAVSLGYDGSEAMMYYDGYRASDDPDFATASALVKARYRTVIVQHYPKSPPVDTTDDLPW